MNGLLLSRMAPHSNDLAMAAAAVAQNGLALKYTSDQLKEDAAVVTIAVGQNGSTLRLASDPIKADREVVMKAVANPATMFLSIKEEYRDEVQLEYRTRLTERWLKDAVQRISRKHTRLHHPLTPIPPTHAYTTFSHR